MKTLTTFLKRSKIRNIAIAVAVILISAWVFAYQPVTRNLIAQDQLCNYCHLPWEFNPDVRMTTTSPHQALPEQEQSQAKCVDCHLPEGWWNATYAYTHFLSITDLFGHFRDREAERSADWIPPRAATAYRVRDRMFEYDSATCRTCHIESEIKPERKRGINAHNLALEENKTCIECHYNLVHRQVDLRKDAFKNPVSNGDQNQ
jgi:nitrate/TMAO reductase-like tetraheme cytochrome c subunit